MATERTNDSRAFRDFLDAKLTHSEASLPLDEALALWDYENRTDEEREDTIQAIREGLEDMDARRTRPIEEFDREFRERHNLPPRS